MIISSNPSKVLADGSNLEFFGIHPGCCYVQKTSEFCKKVWDFLYLQGFIIRLSVLRLKFPSYMFLRRDR